MNISTVKVKSVIYFLLFSIFTIVLPFTLISGSNNTDFIPYFLFLVIALIAVLNISFNANTRGFSINIVHWIFVYIFLFLAPMFQFRYSDFPWNLSPTNGDIIAANLVIILWSIIYMFARLIKSKDYKAKVISNHSAKIHPITIGISFLLSTIIIIYALIRIGFINLLSRYSYTNSLFESGNSMLFLIFNTTIRSFAIFSFVLLLFYIKGKRQNVFRLFLLLISGFYVFLLYFPLGSGRFWLYMIYLGIFILLFKKIKGRYTLFIVTLFGLVYILPIINIFRYSNFLDSNFSITFTDGMAETFLSGDFDAYSMIVRTISFVSDNGITFGYQLLGAIFFFIPRSIWSNKPIGSGAFIGEHLGLAFTNISSPIIAEAIINFGYIGVVLIAFIFSRLVLKLDRRYNYYSSNRSPIIINLLYPFIVGFTFLIMRGDLLSAFSNLIGFIIPAIILLIINLFLLKNI